MATVRTTILVDEALLKQAQQIAKSKTTTGTITYALHELVRREALNRLADLMGTDPSFGETPRRRPE